MQGRQKALPNQLFDPGKRSVNTRPTLCSAQPFLDVALFEWRESKGAVCARAQLFGADGLLAHQGRRGRCDEDLILAAVWIVSRLLTLFLQKKKVVKKIKKVLLINFFYRMSKSLNINLTTVTIKYVEAELVNGWNNLITVV